MGRQNLCQTPAQQAWAVTTGSKRDRGLVIASLLRQDPVMPKCYFSCEETCPSPLNPGSDLTSDVISLVISQFDK